MCGSVPMTSSVTSRFKEQPLLGSANEKDKKANDTGTKGKRTSVLLSIYRENLWLSCKSLVRNSPPSRRTKAHGVGEPSKIRAQTRAWARKCIGGLSLVKSVALPPLPSLSRWSKQRCLTTCSTGPFAACRRLGHKGLGKVCKSPARMWLSGAEAVARICAMRQADLGLNLTAKRTRKCEFSTK